MSKILPPIKEYASEHNLSPNWSKPFPVNGQGILIFNIVRNNPFAIVVKTKDETLDYDWIALDVQDTSASFHMSLNEKFSNLAIVNDGVGRKVGYEPDKKISYWFSYDRDNLVLKYGKGYRMDETTLMTYDFLSGVAPEDQEQFRKDHYSLFSAEVRKICEQYDISPQPKVKTSKMSAKSGEPASKRQRLSETTHSEEEQKSLIDIEGMVEFDVNPLICNRPYLIKDSSENNLFLLDEGQYTFSASLPQGCQVLYENVKNCELNWPEEVDSVLLSDSIRCSINTPGCILYEKLKEKANEFGESNPDETYLRVTLGSSLGKSPGIPYVLEIWPAGHYSPIHNHGNANAVIKVLYGTIHIQIYNKQVTVDDDKEIIMQFDGNAGNVTWLDRNWYQTHKLINISDDFCATIQCYNYSTADLIHWPYFDFVANSRTIDEFLPNSDFTFQDIRTKVMKEYHDSLTTSGPTVKNQMKKPKMSKRASYWAK